MIRYSADGPAITKTKKAQFLEGEFAYLAHLPRADCRCSGLFCRARGLAGQGDQKDRGRNGQNQAARKTEGTGKAKGRTAQGGNSQGSCPRGNTQGNCPPPAARRCGGGFSDGRTSGRGRAILCL